MVSHSENKTFHKVVVGYDHLSCSDTIIPLFMTVHYAHTAARWRCKKFFKIATKREEHF